MEDTFWFIHSLTSCCCPRWRHDNNRFLIQTSTLKHTEQCKSRTRLTGIVVGMWTLELVIDAGMATGIVCPLGSCKSTGKVPDTGLQGGEHALRTSRGTTTRDSWSHSCSSHDSHEQLKIVSEIQKLHVKLKKKKINWTKRSSTETILKKIINLLMILSCAKLDGSHQPCPDTDFTDRRREFSLH